MKNKSLYEQAWWAINNLFLSQEITDANKLILLEALAEEARGLVNLLKPPAPTREK